MNDITDNQNMDPKNILEPEGKFDPFDDTLLCYNIPKELNAEEGKTLSKDILMGGKKKPQLPPLENKQGIEETLNAMFPPRYFEKNGKTYSQTVSTVESSRVELLKLEENLKKKLKERQARNTGICPVREDLHNQLFDEIIRQSTINCIERGQLLLRVRDNIRMTLAAYQTLYQGSVIFGIRKQLQAEQGRAELENRIQELNRKKIYLENRKIELENELDSIEKSFKEIRSIEENKKVQEINFLKAQAKHLARFLNHVKAKDN